MKHFTSWLCLAPGNKISGGKILSSKTRRSSNKAAAALRLAATTVGRTDTALGGFYRRLSARIGKAKAVTATAAAAQQRGGPKPYLSSVCRRLGVAAPRFSAPRRLAPSATAEQSLATILQILASRNTAGAKALLGHRG